MFLPKVPFKIRQQSNLIIMVYRQLFSFLILLALCCSCHGTQEKALMRKANQLHEEAAHIEADLNGKLKELIQKKNSINIQGRALTQEELAFVDVIENLESNYHQWKELYQQSAAIDQLPTNEANLVETGAMEANKAKDIYANQISLKDNISKLKEEVEATYKKWINEV